MARLTPRQELAAFVGNGNLRYFNEAKLSPAAMNLLVDIVARYCEPRRRRKSRSQA